MNLPKTYTHKTWVKGGSIPEHEQYIGKPQLSWSQVEKWRNTAKESFAKVDGKVDYILSYFLGIDNSSIQLKLYGDFGSEVEDCVCKGDCGNFDSAEIKTLKEISPLGNFQKEIVIDFGDFVLLGYIDDCSPIKNNKIKLVRDYKAKSENSKKDLHSPKKLQLPLYIGALERKGIKVGGAEYCIIERMETLGLYKGGDRSNLKVAGRVWYEPFIYTQETIDTAFKIVEETAVDISRYYSIYQKLNGAV